MQWKKGDLARLPLRDASIDVALLSQSLHHAADPEDALAEAVRVLRPGGRVLVLDLREHDQTWVRGRFGDQRLGFADADLDVAHAPAPGSCAIVPRHRRRRVQSPAIRF